MVDNQRAPSEYKVYSNRGNKSGQLETLEAILLPGLGTITYAEAEERAQRFRDTNPGMRVEVRT
jgi:hypothetical protein